MSVLTFERKKLDVTNTYTATVTVGAVARQANDFYLPVTIDGFTTPDVVLASASIAGTSGQNKITSTTPDYFKAVYVGDIVSTTTDFVAGPSAPVLTDIALNALSNVFVYPSTFTSITLPLAAGDTVTSTSLPVNTVVDKIDYANRIVYLSNPSPVTIIENVTVIKPLRVTAKNLTNTEITVSRNLSAVAGSGGPLTVKRGAQEALLGLLKIAPVGSTTSGTVSLQVGAYKNQGDKVDYSANGSGYSAPEELNYVSLGSVSIDADAFLEAAGIARS